MFRGNAFGSFKDLLLNVTKDPAMLVWLNGNQNVKQKPNENYAREMMELFTLGAEPRRLHRDRRARAGARAHRLAGQRRQPAEHRLLFNPARHDTGHEDDLRQDRQLQLGGLVPALPRQPGAPVVLRREDVELLHPDEDRQRDVEGAAGALREPAGAARRRVDPAAPGLLRGAAHGQAAGRPQRRPAADARPLHRHVGLVDARPAGGPAALLPAGRRRLGRHALARHGDVPRALVHRRASPRTPRRRPTARATRRSCSTARSRSGARRRSRRRRRACSSRSRRRSSSARSTPATSRPRCAG